MPFAPPVQKGFKPPEEPKTVGGFKPPVETQRVGGFLPPQEGFFTRAYRNTLEPILDYFSENEEASKKLIPIETTELPKPTTDPRIATLQLLSKAAPEDAEDIIAEVGKLIAENKLFTEEGAARIPIEPGYANQVLVTGVGEPKKYRRDISFAQAIKEGQQESALGILTGRGIQDYETLLQRSESEIPFLKRQAKNISKIIGDLPAFTVGGVAASLPVGGPETPWGAVLAGSGAFATQTLLESAYNEALRLVSEHPELSGKTLEQISNLVTNPESLKTIALPTAEAGALGALIAVNPLFKALEKTPLAKLFQSSVIRGTAKGASEIATLTVVPQALRGKIPTAEDFIDNAVLVGGLKVAGATAQKLAQWAKRGKETAENVASKLGEKFTLEDEKELANAKTIEEVDEILDRVSKKTEAEVFDLETKKNEIQPEPKQAESEQPSANNRLKIEGKEYEVDSYSQSLLDQANDLYKDALENVDNPSYYASRIEMGKKLENEAKKRIKEHGEVKKKLPKELTARTGLVQPEQERRPLNPSGKETNVPKKSDIISLFKESFKDTPFRIGKFTPKLKNKASGYYKFGTNVIRLKEAGMIETAAHEFGHKLHMALLGGEGTTTQQLQKIQRELAPFMHELRPISRYEPHNLEGFAEFVRMYVTRPDSAKLLAPEFYSFFEERMKKQAPEVLDNMLQARDMYERYLEADPVARTYAHIQSGFDKSLWKKGKDWFNKSFTMDNVKTVLLDDLFPIKRAVADTVGIDPVQVENWKSPLNAYIQARVLKGWVGKSEVFLKHETFNAKTLEANGKGLKQILAPIKTVGERQELSAYLVAKRSRLLRRRGIESGLDQATEFNTIKQLEAKYDPIAEELNDYQNRVLEYYRDSGMISQDSFNKIKALNEFYVPFFRFFEEGERRIGQRTGGDTGRLQADNQIKRIFGSTREVIDPLESIINNTFAMIQASEKNQFGQTLSKLTKVNPRGGKFMEEVPAQKRRIYQITRNEIIESMLKEAKKKDLKMSEVGGDENIVNMLAQIIPDTLEKWRAEAWGPEHNVVTVYFDGKPKYFETIPEIADLYKRGGSRAESNWIVKLLSLPNRTLRAGAILNPRFIQKNAVRDFLGGILYTKHTDVPIIDEIYKPLRGIVSSINKDEIYVDWLKAGGGMSTMQSVDKNLVAVKKGLGAGLDRVRPIAFMRRLAEISEEMNRLSEYAKAIDAMGTDRWQKEMAAFQSRDISVDFAKYGSYTKAINQLIPFWNATIQGGDKLVRTFASKDPKVIQDFLTRVTAGIVLPSLLLQVANNDDKDIAEIDETTKDTNFLFRDPISNDIIQIPVPFETGVLFHGLTRRLYNAIVKEDPEAFKGFFGTIKEVAIPGFIVTAAAPPFETWANKNFFTNRAIVPPSQVGLISEEQYSVFTSKTARLIGKAMTYLPGIDAYESSLTSPAIIEHWIKAWGGGLASLALKLSDEALRLLGIEPAIAKPEEHLLDRLGLNAFIKKYPTASTKSVEEFYEVWDRWNKLGRSIEAKIDKGDIDGAKKLQLAQRNLCSIDLKPLAKSIQKNQATINNIYNNPNMSSHEKSVMIEKFYLQQIEMARSYMYEIKRHRKEVSEKQTP